MRSFKKYRPAIVIILLGVLFLTFPELAAFLLGGGLLTMGFIYALIVFKWNHAHIKPLDGDTFEAEVRRSTEPSFKDVSVTIFQKYS